MMTQRYPDWRPYSDAKGDTWWATEYLGYFAKVTRRGQAWLGRVWPQNDDHAGYEKHYGYPSEAMASLELWIEADVRARS